MIEHSPARTGEYPSDIAQFSIPRVLTYLVFLLGCFPLAFCGARRLIKIKNLYLFLQMSTKFLQSDFVIMEQGILTVAHRSQHALTLKLSVSSVLYYCRACIKLTSSFPSVAFRLLSVELTGRSLSRICTSSYK